MSQGIILTMSRSFQSPALLRAALPTELAPGSAPFRDQLSRAKKPRRAHHSKVVWIRRRDRFEPKVTGSLPLLVTICSKFQSEVTPPRARKRVKEPGVAADRDRRVPADNHAVKHVVTDNLTVLCWLAPRKGPKLNPPMPSTAHLPECPCKSPHQASRHSGVG